VAIFLGKCPNLVPFSGRRQLGLLHLCQNAQRDKSLSKRNVLPGNLLLCIRSRYSIERHHSFLDGRLAQHGRLYILFDKSAYNTIERQVLGDSHPPATGLGYQPLAANSLEDLRKDLGRRASFHQQTGHACGIVRSRSELSVDWTGARQFQDRLYRSRISCLQVHAKSIGPGSLKGADHRNLGLSG
jgi:hypothetical protein